MDLGMSGTYSPQLSLVTGAFEVAVALWALRSSGRREILVPTALLLFALAGYQFLEVLVCGAPGDATWPRLAFADVVWLPPLGMWLVLTMSAPRHRVLRPLVQASFVAAAGLSAWILLTPDFVTSSVCDAVFATYGHGTPYYDAYGAFYHVGLAGILFGGGFALVHTDDRARRAHIADVQLGVLGFVVPALLTEVLVPNLNTSTPSVMCHYALVFAVFLARLVTRERRIAFAATVSGVHAPGQASAARGLLAGRIGE